MAKRKQSEPDPLPEEPVADTPSKRRRKIAGEERLLPNGIHTNGTPTKGDTPARRTRRTAAETVLDEEEPDEGSPTPKLNGRTLFATPSKSQDNVVAVTPSRSVKAKADISARRKSARLLAEAQIEEGDDDDDLGGQDTRLAREILDEEDDEDEGEETRREHIEVVTDDVEVDTPSKQTRSKRTRKIRTPKPPARSPTPEGDIAPEERYFYQNRPGPPQVSSNKFNSVKLFTHDEYHEQNQAWKDPHESERAYLMKLHKRSFPQWEFELEQGFGVCLYGYGSKRTLVNNFAQWLWKKRTETGAPLPTIVIVNGYTPKLNIRTILNTLASGFADDEGYDAIKLTGQPEEMLDTFLSHLTANIPAALLYILINSIDAPSLRRPTTQSLLSRLAAHPSVQFLCTEDTPTFATLWNSTLLDAFRFVYHDSTTFAPFEAELGNVVDDVHEMLGRKRMRTGGKDGVGFVLKSLPENARNLYRLLLSEILTLLDNDDDGHLLNGATEHDEDDDTDEARAPRPAKSKAKVKPKPKPFLSTVTNLEDVGIEYQTLYRKATEDFICSSTMNFQFLLKEFLDHQMITTRRDGVSGAEMLGVPLERAEMEGVLGELV